MITQEYRYKDLIEEINTEEYVSRMDLEEYNLCSKIYSAITRDEAINEHGVRKGYFDTGLHKSSFRGRDSLLKITGRVVTVDVLFGPLLDLAKEMGGTVLEGYMKFLDVNTYSSKIRYTGGAHRGWTDLCRIYFEEYNEAHKLTKEGTTWEQYEMEFKEIYGIDPYEFGSWDTFYVLFSHWFKIVVGEFLSRMLEVLKGRLDD